jgi:RNA polymerase sigma factor (sigma-70 family)
MGAGNEDQEMRLRFERLITPLTPALHRFAVRQMQNEHDAEDAVQETLYRAFRSFAGFGTNGTNFQSWVFCICRNLCLNILIKQEWRAKQLEKYPDAFPISQFLDGVRAEDLIQGPKKPPIFWKRRLSQQRLAWILLQAVHAEVTNSPYLEEYKQRLETALFR